MKTTFAILVLVLAVLVSGCTTTAPSAPIVPPVTTAAPAIPSLVGTWDGPVQGYDEGTGYTNYSHLGIVMVVTEQRGRLFSGHMVFTANGTESIVGIAGATGRDGRTFMITEKSGGYSFGEFLGPDEMEMTYMEDGSPYSIAVDSFKRVKGP